MDTKNQADSAVYQTKKQLEEFGDKAPADLKSTVEDKLKALGEAVAADNIADMKSGQEALQEAMMALGQAVYSQGAPGPEAGGAPGAEAGGAPPPPPGGAAADGPDDVIDASFTDADKKDK